MNTIGYLVFGYMVFGILLVFRTAYLRMRLARYIYKQYPEEGKVIRSYAWQRYPGSMFHKTLKALIEKHSISDFELTHRAKIATHSSIYFLVWFVLALVMFFIRILFFLVK